MGLRAKQKAIAVQARATKKRVRRIEDVLLVFRRRDLHRNRWADDLFPDRHRHQLRFVVDVELAHEIEFVRLDGLDADA